MVHTYDTYTRKKTKTRVKKERNRKEKKEKKQKGNKLKEEKKGKTKTSVHSGSRPSPEGARLLFGGTISPMMCPVDGPAEGRHATTRRKTRKEKEEGRDTELKKTKQNKTKPAFPCPAGGHGRHKRPKRKA